MLLIISLFIIHLLHFVLGRVLVTVTDVIVGISGLNPAHNIAQAFNIEGRTDSDLTQSLKLFCFLLFLVNVLN